MNILVVGANGLVGKVLSKKLRHLYNIYRLISLYSNKEYPTDIKIDLANMDIKELPKKIDVIYYLAQSNHFREFPTGSMDMININVYAPVLLANWGIENGVKKFIYASSGGVYKNPTQPVHEFLDISANEKNGFYLDSKLSAEILLRNFSSFFETFVIVRPFFIYGPEQKKTMLIPRLINNIEQGNIITLSGEQGIKINPIYVDDAAYAMSKLLELKGEYLFNIAGKEIVSLKQLIELISSILGKKPLVQINNTEQYDLIADISMMIKFLCIPSVSLEEGIEKTIKGILKK